MKRSPPRLSAERILRAAEVVVDRDGLEAFSMRRLAQELDVWPMSLYRYFRDKDELLDALAASAAGEVVAAGEGASWREEMVALLRGARGTMSADTGSRLPRVFLTPEVLRLSESGVAILRRAGCSNDEAPAAWRTLWSYTFGFATFVLAATEAEAGRRTRSAITALPEEEFPVLASCADEFAGAFAADVEFDRGLERLLDGIEATIADG